MKLTQEYMYQLFTFNADLGDLIWNYREDRTPQWNGRYADTIAGSVVYYNTSGPYRVINIDGVPQLAHRLIWLYLNGYLPNKVDHKDGNGLNNREYNLREATQSQNQANMHRLNRGVEKRGNSYRARIKVNGEIVQLGSFKSFEVAQSVYHEASDKYFGEFARCNREI